MFLTLIVAAVVLSFPSVAHGAPPSCRDEANRALRANLAMFRAHVYGLSQPAEAPTMTVRSDGERDFYKWVPNQWRTLAEGFEELTITDSEMAERQVPPSMKGYLETKGVETSRLVPLIGQAAVALRCDLLSTCDLMRASIAVAGKTLVTVKPRGCIAYERPTLAACVATASTSDQPELAETAMYCDRVAEGLFTHEMALTEAAVHHRAGYVALLHLAGSLERTLEGLRFPLLRNLRQVVDLVGNFHRIPCFVASCGADLSPQE